MWYPHTVTVAPVVEPVTLAEAKAQCRIDGNSDDGLLQQYISEVRDHVETYCGVALAPQTVTINCDGFSDFARLPVVPLISIVSISYVDEDGDQQTLSADIYEARSDGLIASIALRNGKAWPKTEKGSRVMVTAQVGSTKVPPKVRGAMLLMIGDRYENRENTVIGESVTQLPLAAEALLENYRVFTI